MSSPESVGPVLPVRLGAIILASVSAFRTLGSRAGTDATADPTGPGRKAMTAAS